MISNGWNTINTYIQNTKKLIKAKLFNEIKTSFIFKHANTAILLNFVMADDIWLFGCDVVTRQFRVRTVGCMDNTGTGVIAYEGYDYLILEIWLVLSITGLICLFINLCVDIFYVLITVCLKTDDTLTGINIFHLCSCEMQVSVRFFCVLLEFKLLTCLNLRITITKSFHCAQEGYFLRKCI